MAKRMRHAGPVPAARSPEALGAALAAAAVLVRLALLVATRVTFEDAYISLRYAENLARGIGLVYNPGEPVFGASTPLYVLFLAALVRLGLPALLVARVLAALADGLTLFLWVRWLFRRTGRWTGPAFFALLFGLSPAVAPVSVSGMETAFALLLLSVALLAALEPRRGPAGAGRSGDCPRSVPGLRRGVGMGVALGLLTLLRPEGLLAAAAILGFRWFRDGRFPGTAAAVAVALPLPWVVWATAFYGSPLPHSIVAKAVAYNLHREGLLPNFLETLAQLAPIRGQPGRLLALLVAGPCLALGLREAWRARDLRLLPTLFGLWWAYLVLPNTLLFAWYFPPFLLPAYVLAALGAARALDGEAGLRPMLGRVRLRPAALALLAVGMTAWLVPQAERIARIQRAEESVRLRIGLWLRERTPESARVALEPIGYIGYYSRRRILDEVGLVSPEMVPLNRAGDGWFARMLEAERPDYVVERPGYLLRNLTINSGVPMFRTQEERLAFLAAYRPVASFSDSRVPERLAQDYRFVIYARRAPAAARQWRARWERLSPSERAEALVRALTGEPDRPVRTARAPGALRQR